METVAYFVLTAGTAGTAGKSYSTYKGQTLGPLREWLIIGKGFRGYLESRNRGGVREGPSPVSCQESNFPEN